MDEIEKKIVEIAERNKDSDEQTKWDIEILISALKYYKSTGDFYLSLLNEKTTKEENTETFNRYEVGYWEGGLYQTSIVRAASEGSIKLVLIKNGRSEQIILDYVRNIN